MDKENFQTSYMHKTEDQHEGSWRHHCGCIRTSDKLKQILKSFPTTPPPSPSHYELPDAPLNSTCISAYCTGVHQPVNAPDDSEIPNQELRESSPPAPSQKDGSNWNLKITNLVTKNKILHSGFINYVLEGTVKTWRVVGDLVQLLQLSVTATALALYYLIYCYMQVIYYTLRSALYFHNADGPMKITIGVVTVSSLVVGFNLILRMERLIGIFQ